MILSLLKEESVILNTLKLSVVLFGGIALFATIWTERRFKKWRQNGKRISEKIGLRRIIIFESDLIQKEGYESYELHHQPQSFLTGFKYAFQPKRQIIEKMKKELQEDYEKLDSWAKERNVFIFTTTHPKMAKLWEETSKPYFRFISSYDCADPWVEMNLLQWVAATFSTTGRIGFSPPKQWETYYLDRGGGKF
ncbi:hypothetical protein L1765_10060 [Microaerobacter geothermalis]|uniref:hypothetical protein n=1 Tax=Microaerobacter geothermalis TaxID=674972 RepID=UPI001F24B2B6|nr:hypothetical protein [Microaerobacter geothermalis]MCF6094306.1 hypothetical protein [Microaerobacter geothermalis]